MACVPSGLAAGRRWSGPTAHVCTARGGEKAARRDRPRPHPRPSPAPRSWGPLLQASAGMLFVCFPLCASGTGLMACAPRGCRVAPGTLRSHPEPGFCLRALVRPTQMGCLLLILRPLVLAAMIDTSPNVWSHCRCHSGMDSFVPHFTVTSRLRCLSSVSRYMGCDGSPCLRARSCGLGLHCAVCHLSLKIQS